MEVKFVFRRRLALPVVVAAVLLQNADAAENVGLRRQLVTPHSFAEEQAAGTGCFTIGQEFSGFEVAEFDKVEDPGVCRKMCDQHPLCEYFTHLSDRRLCRLHGRRPADHKENSKALSGAKRCPLCYLTGYDFQGERNRVENGEPGITTFTACQAACEANPNCHAFLFSKGRKLCHMKVAENAVNSLTKAQDYMAAPKTCGEHWCISDNVDYPGNDLYSLATASAADCQNACFDEPRCNFFSWEKHNKACWVKSGEGVPRTRTKKDGVQSGPSNCGMPPSTCYEERTKYVGSVVKQFTSAQVGNIRSCEKACWNNAKCVYFHFNKDGCVLSDIRAVAVGDENSKAGNVTC